ncbi:MAG TPA: macrolide ABC transporter ATP-binding protein [Clostridiales bacterium]|nr:macrolide ABC transporter ATP-binding protein [Clostridiales bacterium]
MSDIVVSNVSKSFDKREILHSLSFTVKSGDFLSITGESGSGKSTLLSIMGGVMRPDGGKVELGGTDIASLSEKALAKMRRTRLGFVYQFFNLIPTMTVRDNILLPLILDGKKPSLYREKFDELVSFTHLGAVLDSYPGTLSGGEQQRAAILRALIHDPEVILLDEPTGNLDSENAHAVMTLLSDLNRKYGVTVVQVTHSEQGAAYGNRVITIKDGSLA